MTLTPYSEAWRERMSEKKEGSALCGWCLGPPGARRPHKFGTPVNNCPCGCHRKPRPAAVVAKMLANNGVLTDPRIAEFMGGGTCVAPSATARGEGTYPAA